MQISSSLKWQLFYKKQIMQAEARLNTCNLFCDARLMKPTDETI